MGGMSTLSISGGDPTRATYGADDANESAGAEPARPEQPDFSGAAYARVSLPTGMIAAHTTKSELAKDAKALDASARKVAEDLKSPELRHLLVAGGKIGFHASAVLLSATKLAVHAPAAMDGDPLSILKCGLDVHGLAYHTVELALAAKSYEKADTPEARAKLDGLLRDLSALEASAKKFAIDAPKLAAGF